MDFEKCIVVDIDTLCTFKRKKKSIVWTLQTEHNFQKVHSMDPTCDTNVHTMYIFRLTKVHTMDIFNLHRSILWTFIIYENLQMCIVWTYAKS